jgi:hypothetical protein
MSDTPKGRREISLCLSEVGVKPVEGLYHLVKCSASYSVFNSRHPIPNFSESRFMVAKMRAEWLASCVVMLGNEIGDCLKKKESDYRVVFDHYSSFLGLSKNSPGVIALEKCLDINYITANYSIVKACVLK